MSWRVCSAPSTAVRWASTPRRPCWPRRQRVLDLRRAPHGARQPPAGCPGCRHGLGLALRRHVELCTGDRLSGGHAVLRPVADPVRCASTSIGPGRLPGSSSGWPPAPDGGPPRDRLLRRSGRRHPGDELGPARPVGNAGITTTAVVHPMAGHAAPSDRGRRRRGRTALALRQLPFGLRLSPPRTAATGRLRGTPLHLLPRRAAVAARCAGHTWWSVGGGKTVGQTLFCVVIVALALMMLRVAWLARLGRSPPPSSRSAWVWWLSRSSPRFSRRRGTGTTVATASSSRRWWCCWRCGHSRRPSPRRPSLPTCGWRPHARRRRSALWLALVLAGAGLAAGIGLDGGDRTRIGRSADPAACLLLPLVRSERSGALRWIRAMAAHHIRDAYGDYWTAYTLDFLAPPRSR